jgi:hypothetical protein
MIDAPADTRSGFAPTPISSPMNFDYLSLIAID